jgi:hypothetical protein
MPKARKLPTDPEARAKMERERAANRAKVKRWRERHPAKRRLITRCCVQAYRAREKAREAYRMTA